MTVQSQVFLNFVILIRVNVATGVLLSVHHTLLQSRKYLAAIHGGWVSAHSLKHLQVDGNGHSADLQALHVLHCLDGAYIIGNMAKSEITKTQAHIAKLIQLIQKSLAKLTGHYLVYLLNVIKQIRQGK